MLLKPNSFNRKKFIRIFISNIIGWIIVLVSEFFDSFLAGNFVDADAVAAIELVTPVDYIFYAIAVLLSFSSGVLYSRALGERDKLLSEKIAGMTMIVNIVGGLLMTLIIYILSPAYVSMFVCSDAVRNYAIQFMRYRSLSFVFNFAYYGIYQLIVYDGNEVLILLSDILLFILSIVCPYVLTLKIGFIGIALADCVVFFLGILLLLVHFLSKRNSIAFKPYFSLDILMEMFKLSSVSTLTNIYIAVVDIIFNAIIVNRFGDNALPAYTVVNMLLNYAEITAAAIGSGQIFVSTYYGEKSYKSIRNVMKMIIKYALILGVGLSVASILLAPYWPSIFVIEDPVAAEYAIFAGYVIPLTYVFASWIYTYKDYYPIIDKPLYGNVIVVLYMLVLPLGVCIPLVYILGFKAMVLGFALIPLITIVCIYLYFFFTKKEDVPMFLPKFAGTEIHYDLMLDVDSITEVKNLIFDELRENDIDSKIANEACVVAEDSLVSIMEENKKKITAEITILFDKKELRLIIKDNGKIFDLMEIIKKSMSLRAYTIDRLTDQIFKKENDVAISFNRNTFSWIL